MRNFGFYFGVPMGVILTFVVNTFPDWWILPVGGIVTGYLVNYIAIKMIFEPVFPRKVGRFTLHGLFLRRQPEVSDLFAKEVINLHNVANELLYGPRSDRTHQMLSDTLRPAIDKAIGPRQRTLR